MQFAVTYKLKKHTWVVNEKGKAQELNDLVDKMDFLGSLQEGDEVYLPFGSGADKFALAAIQHSAKVFRIPTTKMAEFMKDIEPEPEPEVMEDVEPEEPERPEPDEIGYGEDRDKRGSRTNKARARRLMELAKDRPELFYFVRPKDSDVLIIGNLLKRYYIIQEDVRKPAQQRLFIERAEAMLLEPRPEGDRKMVMKRLQDEIKEHPLFLPAIEEEKRLYQEIDRFVRGLPIFGPVFGDIVGVGGVIAGRILYAIADVRRFPDEGHLKNYAGYGFERPGPSQNANEMPIQRRRKKRASSWNRVLKQGIFLFCDQANRRPGTFWGDILLAKKEELRARFPRVVTETRKTPEGDVKVRMYTKGHIHNMAMRYVGQKFLCQVFQRWQDFEGIRREEPDSEVA